MPIAIRPYDVSAKLVMSIAGLKVSSGSLVQLTASPEVHVPALPVIVPPATTIPPRQTRAAKSTAESRGVGEADCHSMPLHLTGSGVAAVISLIEAAGASVVAEPDVEQAEAVRATSKTADIAADRVRAADPSLPSPLSVRASLISNSLSHALVVVPEYRRPAGGAGLGGRRRAASSPGSTLQDHDK